MVRPDSILLGLQLRSARSAEGPGCYLRYGTPGGNPTAEHLADFSYHRRPSVKVQGSYLKGAVSETRVLASQPSAGRKDWRVQFRVRAPILKQNVSLRCAWNLKGKIGAIFPDPGAKMLR